MAGRPKKIKDSSTLYKWFEQYKNYSVNNPIQKMDFKGRDADTVHYELERPLTWTGFKVWLYKNHKITNLDEYKANKNNVYSEYSSILSVIGDEIYQHQFDGACVGVFQYGIIARKLGLSEKTENKNETIIKETRIGFE